MDEFWTRSFGAALQLVGVALVVIDLHVAMAKYQQRQNIFERIGRRWHQLIDRLFRRVEMEAITGSASAMLADITVNARGVVQPDPLSMTIAEQVAELYERHRQMKEELRAANARLQALEQTHRADIERVGDDVRDVDQRLVRTAIYIEAGNGRRRLAGIASIAFGIALATWVPELDQYALLVGLAWAACVLMTSLVPELGEPPA